MGFMSQILGRFRYGVGQQALSGSGRAYEAARYDSRELSSWTPRPTEGGEEIQNDRELANRRARDLIRNHPIISGATDRRAESVVGANIRLETQPAFEVMGQSADWADQWSAETEAQFELWGRSGRALCDAEMQLQFGGLVELAYRHWWNDGEAAAVIKMLAPAGPRVGATWETCVEVIDPDRIENPNGKPDNTRLGNGNTLVGGIEYNRHKAPIAAHVRVTHPAAADSNVTDLFKWVRVPFYGPTGRPILVHAFKRNRSGQRRGISRFVSAIKRIKMFDRYDDAEIEAALLNAVMAGFVESPYPTKDVAEGMAPTGDDADEWTLKGQIDYRMDHPVKVAGVRMFHGLPGEKMGFHRAERPSANYPDFQATGLRSIAASLGLSYAQVAQNWADINYSSARAMLNEIWRGLLHDRWLFTQAFCTKIYLAWLEESVAKGIVKVPGRKLDFYKWRDAISLCEWMGPGRGTVDPLKEAQANDFELNQGLTDLIEMNNEQGKDWRKTLSKQSRVAKYRRSLGMDDFVPLKAGAAHGAGEAAQTAEQGAQDAKENA